MNALGLLHLRPIHFTQHRYTSLKNGLLQIRASFDKATNLLFFFVCYQLLFASLYPYILVIIDHVTYMAYPLL